MGVMPSGYAEAHSYEHPLQARAARFQHVPSAGHGATVSCWSVTLGLKGLLSSPVTPVQSNHRCRDHTLCSAPGGQNSVTIWSFTGDAKSSEICEPSSEKSLCLNLVTPIWVARNCVINFTAFADFPWIHQGQGPPVQHPRQGNASQLLRFIKSNQPIFRFLERHSHNLGCV